MRIIASLCLALLILIPVRGQNAKKFYKSGEDFYEAGSYTDAITQFTSAVGINPNYKEAYYMRGLSYIQMKEFEKAVDDFNRAVVFDPKNIDLYYQLGVAYYELKKYNESLDMLNKVTNMNRKYVAAYQEKILVLMAIDQAFNAVKVSDSALALDGSAMNYYLQGLVTEKLNSLQKAEWAYTKSIKEDKKFIKGYIALASLQIQLNKIDDAMNNCNQALALDANSREALVVQSKVYLKKLDYRNAIDDISKAIIIDANDPEMFFIRGTYYQNFSQHQNAINDFNKVISIDPKYAEAYYLRAKSYEEIGNYQAAVKDYNALVSISEYDVKAKKLLKEAQDRLFELNRENDPPKIVLLDPLPKNKTTLEIADNKKTIRLKGYLTDKSDISSLKINNLDVKLDKVNDNEEFVTEVPIDSMSAITVSATDVYNNNQTTAFTIVRTEVDPPKVSIVAPFASDNGEIYLDNNDPSIYVEGKIADASLIKSILIDGVSASFKLDDLNPTFSATININNKDKFTVTATDIYGNEKPATFMLNRESAALLGSNPMGKTWVVFVDNSQYSSFPNLDGPTKDVSLMKTALAKYQVNNIITRNNMTKEQMEKFFSIELRDLVRSNRVNTLLIWYAGHGKFINETGYWIPVDASRDDEFTYFNINFLKASLQSYNSILTHTLVISDACESGPSFYQAMRGEIKERSCDDWQASRLKSSQVFSSAGYELAVDQSQFTKTFANVLANNPNACIPIESIVLKVNTAVSENNQQKPKFGKISGLADEDGTFFFISKK